MESRSDMNQQQTPAVKKINRVTGRITKTKGSGLRGVIILYAQHSTQIHLEYGAWLLGHPTTKEEMLTDWKESRKLPP